MDIVLAKTFLEVLTTGNFKGAATRLFVTQSAVSLRIKRLEEELGREVFLRNKSGVFLTPAGYQFERFARSMVKLWEEAHYQVAVPEGLDSILIFGCQYSLWPKLGMNWLRLMEKEMITTSLKAETGMPDRLMRLMLDGLLDIGVMYTPQLRPGLEVKPLLQDTLVLVSTNPNYPPELNNDYVSVEWSPEFIALHAAYYPQRSKSKISLALGSMSIRYILENDSAAYFPALAVEDFVKAGKLHIIKNAPAFPYPSYVVWNPEKDGNLVERSLGFLDQAVTQAEKAQHKIIKETGLTEIDEGLSNSLFPEV